MGALKILDFKPFLSEESIEKIVSEIVDRLDVYSKEFYTEEISCENGYLIEVHAKNKGMNYRRLSVTYLKVHLFDKVAESYSSDEDCEEYANKISDMLHDKIRDLNDKEEAEFESEHAYL